MLQCYFSLHRFFQQFYFIFWFPASNSFNKKERKQQQMLEIWNKRESGHHCGAAGRVVAKLSQIPGLNPDLECFLCQVYISPLGPQLVFPRYSGLMEQNSTGTSLLVHHVCAKIDILELELRYPVLWTASSPLLSDSWTNDLFHTLFSMVLPSALILTAASFGYSDIVL